MTLAVGDVRNDARDVIAAGHLEVCKALGGQVGLTNPGDAEIILLAMMDKDNTAPRNVGGVVIEPESRTFEIPRQAADPTGDNPTGAFAGKIQENAEIRWIDQVTGAETAVYVVPAGEGGWSMDGLEAIYNVKAVLKTIRRAGP